MGLGDLVFLASAALHDRSQWGAKVVEPRQTKMAFLTGTLSNFMAYAGVWCTEIKSGYPTNANNFTIGCHRALPKYIRYTQCICPVLRESETLREGFRPNKGNCGNLTDTYVALDSPRVAVLV